MHARYPHSISPIKPFIVTALACCLMQTSTLHAQPAISNNPSQWYVPQRAPWSAYDPSLAMSARVFAQADLIRSQGEAEMDFAIARELQAEARKQELKNWEKSIRAEWEMRILKEKKKLELNHARQIAKLKYLNDRKWESSRTWEKYKNHPELSSYNIRTGKAQNFLLARMASTALEYEFDEADSRYGPDVLSELTLDDELLEHITLTQGGFEFSANQSVQEEISQWPYLLRWNDFRAERDRFEAARKQVVKESEAGGDVSVDSIQKLQDTQMQLAKKFYFSSRVWDWVKQHRRYAQREDAMQFLAQLDREIKRLQTTGDIRPFQGRGGYDPAIHGRHVISLLTFMNRNGIEFAASKPGSEFAYHRLFVMMRAVYLTVAEEDESIRPEDLSQRIKAK